MMIEKKQAKPESPAAGTLAACALAATMGALAPLGAQGQDGTTIASFESESSIEYWGTVNDTVMGGVSSSSIERTDEGTLLFIGELSLENNGGFVSIRNQPAPLRLQSARGIEIQVRGDGRRYFLDLRAERQRMAGSFRAPFTTKKGEWQTLEIPLESFYAQTFGRARPEVALNRGAIRSIGFTLSDGQPGPFALEVKTVRAIDTAALEAPALDLPPGAAQRLIIERAITLGVPLFNEGNPAACAAIYEVACMALNSMPDTPESARTRLQQALGEIQALQNESRKAWILRYAIDDTLAALSAMADPQSES